FVGQHGHENFDSFPRERANLFAQPVIATRTSDDGDVIGSSSSDGVYGCFQSRDNITVDKRSSSRPLNFNNDTRRHVMTSESYESGRTPKGVVGQPDMEPSAEPNHKPIPTQKNRPTRSFQKSHHC